MFPIQIDLQFAFILDTIKYKLNLGVTKMKVIKFGGSSVASAKQLNKVLAIVKQDPDRRFVVVSAPGKRDQTDKKVTDLLITYYHIVKEKKDPSAIVAEIFSRYQQIAADLALTEPLELLAQLKNLAQTADFTDPYLLDRFLSTGENLNAQLVAEFFKHAGLAARYLDPKELGITVTAEPQNARVLNESYDKISHWKDSPEILVIPGFFGYTQAGNICTFSRGGSDITGSIVAAGVKAELYENFTDVDGIFAANPKFVHKPELMKCATYREMRELSYAGFSVFHDEALMPSFKANIPVVIKNTNNPDSPGSTIKQSHAEDQNQIVGIASDDGFSSINISKYLLNREVGIVGKVLRILEERNVSFEHMPSGIDDISIILRSHQLDQAKEEELLRAIAYEIDPDSLVIEHGLSVVVLVGEGMKYQPNITADSTAALARKNVNIRMLSQGAGEVSIVFAIKSEQERAAVRSLYYTFFD